jgi:hypothetical protein
LRGGGGDAIVEKMYDDADSILRSKADKGELTMKVLSVRHGLTRTDNTRGHCVVHERRAGQTAAVGLDVIQQMFVIVRTLRA